MELESVISAIKLAQIEEVARSYSSSTGSAPGSGVLGGPEGQEDSRDALEVLGDEISPKRWSYRRLLVTGSGLAKESTLASARENRELNGRISALESEIAMKEEVLELLPRGARLPRRCASCSDATLRSRGGRPRSRRTVRCSPRAPGATWPR